MQLLTVAGDERDGVALVDELDDIIDMSAGIILNKKVGDSVKKGELLATLYTNKEESIYLPIKERVEKAFVIKDKKIEKDEGAHILIQ